MKKSLSIEESIEQLADLIDTVEMIGECLSGEEVYTKPVDRKQHESELINSGGWKCKCGSVNASYVGSCHCGGTKQADSVPYVYQKKVAIEHESKLINSGGWKCKCGSVNASYVGSCHCGRTKQADSVPYVCQKKVEIPPEPPVTETAKETIAAPEPVKETIAVTETAKETIAAPEPVKETIAEQESLKDALPKIVKMQETRIEKRNENCINKTFANPFRDEEEKEWKCSRCGTIKPSFMPICECGMSKRNNG